MTDKLFIVGKGDIALKLACAKNTVIRYIRHEGLPAFRETHNGPYKVTPDALREWAAEYQARKYTLKNPVKG